MFAWMHAACRERARAERALFEAANAVTAAARDGGESVLRALAEALSALDPGIDAMLAFRQEGDELECVFSYGNRAEYFAGMRLRAADGSLPWRALLCGHHVSFEPGGRPVIPSDRAAIAAPVCAAPAAGAVVYASGARTPNLSRDSIARMISNAAVAYALAREIEADRANATYDALTGLYTARAFRNILQNDLRAAELGRATTLSLWFVDTDEFKSVNDRFGHAAGDAVLQRIARLLNAHLVPDMDLGARNGGDEFCAVLRNAHKTEAIVRAQAFCEAVRACDFGVRPQITASVGVAAFPYDARSPSELLEAADAAMYHSKRSGRDRVAYPDGSGSFAVHR